MTPPSHPDTASPADLDDETLRAWAHDWRRRALRGESFANGRAHELEVELRRRRPPEGAAPPASPLRPVPRLGDLPAPRRGWRLGVLGMRLRLP